MDDQLLINLIVAGSKLPLKVKPSEEEAYRLAAKTINSKLEQYKSSFTSVPDIVVLEEKDYIVMTAIQAVTEKAKYVIRIKSLEEEVTRLTQELDTYLKKNI